MSDELLFILEFSQQLGPLVRIVFALDGSAEFLGFFIKLLLLHVVLNFDFFLDSVISHLELFGFFHQELGLVDFYVFGLLLGVLAVEVGTLGAGLVGDTFHTRQNGLVNEVGSSLFSVDLSLLDIDLSLNFLNDFFLLLDFLLLLSVISSDLFVLSSTQLLHQVGLLALSVISKLVFNRL